MVSLASVADHLHAHGLGRAGDDAAHGLCAQRSEVRVLQLAQGDLVDLLHVQLAHDAVAGSDWSGAREFGTEYSLTEWSQMEDR